MLDFCFQTSSHMSDLHAIQLGMSFSTMCCVHFVSINQDNAKILEMLCHCIAFLQLTRLKNSFVVKL